MKYIARAVLQERLDRTHDPKLFGFLAAIITECEEIDTLTVTKLRPMRDAPRDRRSILCALNGSVVLREMYFTEGFWWLSGTDSYFNDSHLQGWVPEVIYKPELTGE